ncbi:enoyl-CoA hydratase-related protein [Streptococcus suis]|nr:enoyl-CoA hydratase-related protein [Streptococcus suis]
MSKPQLEYLLLEEKGNTAIVTINRPEAMNALSTEVWRELKATVDYLNHQEDIRAVILTGAGDKAFAAGADVKNLLVKKGKENLSSFARDFLLGMQNSRLVFIAAINGYAFGGGLELSMFCDIRIASTTALLGLPETNLGLLPGAGGTQKLVRLTNESIAKQVILGGRILSAEEGVASGLIMQVAEPAELLTVAEKVAKRVTAKGPIAVMLAKRVINSANDVDIHSGLLFENLAFSVLLDTNDKVEGINAFLEKRKAEFKSE